MLDKIIYNKYKYKYKWGEDHLKFTIKDRLRSIFKLVLEV